MIPSRSLLALGACLLAACTHDRPQNLTVEDAKDCPITLHTGQTLTLSLTSNPTTGYRWRIQQAAGDILRSLGPEVFDSPREQGMVGAAGRSTWRYHARQPGSGRLVMVYQQPWAPEEAPAQTFDCTIEVK